MNMDSLPLFDVDPDHAGILPTPPPAPAEPKLSYTRRLTLKRQTMLAAGVHPATRRPLLDPERGLTCGGCAHLAGYGHNNTTYWKCELAGATRGPATDVRRKWPACDRHTPASETTETTP